MRTHAVVLALAALACATGPSPRNRRTAEIHHDLGVEALRAGRAADALKEFDQALAVDDRFPEAHRGRGLVLDLGFGRTEEAERAYLRALELRPEYPEAQSDLGQLYARTGRLDQALGQFDAALADLSYREPWVARCNKGLALHRMGRKAEGIAELKASLALAPRFCKGHRELGRIFLEENRLPEALEELSTYARVCEKTPDAHLQLGMARMRNGDVAGAREALERCVELGDAVTEGAECRRTLDLLK
jgi:Tfp pilus assembly protein PilF